ncbi:FkbM family methyltransferase [Humisphaera borealis]|uniref:FkbM family methyltransferase n=1 Tax=Humisphaera borealis TaxID=2807512 RepID=A0A7M2WYS3_9BACT|nr:FkbM family methyltransferase [Humisphaera borealis]QOV90625.1 FkbM family methyltransferase [Humisphaera borealis]
MRPSTTDLAVVNEASLADPYAVAGITQLPADAVVIDVGANIGDFTMSIARSCPKGRVVAIEPAAEHCRMIEVQKLLNGFDHVTVVRTALGGSEGEVRLHGAGSHSSVGFGNGTVETVRQTTLGNLMSELSISTVSLLKLDCEGAEWEIIPSSEDVLPQIQRIVMEFHCTGDWTPARLADWLRARGFEVGYTPGLWNGLLWAVQGTSPERIKDGSLDPPAF